MHIVFSTHQDFIRRNFPRVRKKLRGEVVVFDGSRFNLNKVVKNVVKTWKTSDRSTHIRYQRTGASKTTTRRAKKPLSGFKLKITNTVLSFMMIAGIVVGSVMLIPSIYYALFPADVVEVQASDVGTAFGGNYETGSVEAKQEEKYIPPQDETLPKGDWIVIPRIGVRSELQPTQNPEEALATGMWLVPDFGRAGDTETPMIVAAHRFGWEWWWQSDYWKYNSFYNLPTTEPGDRVEIISDQRKWVYEIYAGEEGEEISDYEADLILYTCKFLKSPLRHFRYARLIDPTKNTQK